MGEFSPETTRAVRNNTRAREIAADANVSKFYAYLAGTEDGYEQAQQDLFPKIDRLERLARTVILTAAGFCLSALVTAVLL